MDIEIDPIAKGEKPALRRLMELYLYDFSEYDQADVNEHGTYEYEYLDHYWIEADRHAFFIRAGGKLAGFALIREIKLEDGSSLHSLAEFFVMRKYRRKKVGKGAAHRLFGMFPGRWQVAQEEANLPSQKFWREVIGEYTGGRYAEVQVEGWQGPAQEFEAGGR